MAFPEEPESGVEGWKKAAALKALLEQPSASEDRHEGKAFETASQYLALEAVRPGCPLEEANKTVLFCGRSSAVEAMLHRESWRTPDGGDLHICQYDFAPFVLMWLFYVTFIRGTPPQLRVLRLQQLRQADDGDQCPPPVWVQELG